MARFQTEVRASRAMAGAAVALGATAAVAPGLLIRVYGLPDTAPYRTLMRLWGTRTTTLGALVFLGLQPADRLLAAATAMNAADAVVSAAAGDGLSLRSKVMATGTSAAFAAGGLAALLGVVD